MTSFMLHKVCKGESAVNKALLASKNAGLFLYDAHKKYDIAPATFRLWLGRYLEEGFVEISKENIGKRVRHKYFLTPKGEEYLESRKLDEEAELSIDH